MTSRIDLDVLLEKVDELSAGSGSTRSEFLAEYGLRLHDRLERWTYSSTPLNSVTFGSTGGDGVHFGLLLSESTTERDGPVVMTVPMAGQANHVIAESVGEFLGLGCVHGWFSLEQLAYRPAYTFELYARADPPAEGPMSELFERLSLSPRALHSNRLEELRHYVASIGLAPSPSVTLDRGAFHASKHSKSGKQ